MITIEQFIKGGLPDDSPIYNDITTSPEYQQSVDHLGIDDLTECSFGLVKEILMDMESGFDFFAQLRSLNKIVKEKAIKADVMNMELLPFVQQLNYMKDQLSAIIDNERQLLSDSEYDTVAEQAAIGDGNKSLFAGIEVYMQLRSLANEDITKIDQVERMKYSDCLLELYTRQQIARFERNYERLSKLKNK